MPKDDSFPLRKPSATFSSTRCRYWDHATLLFSRYAPTPGASTKPQVRVNRQLSPWRIRYSPRTNNEGWITIRSARSPAAAPLARLRPPSIPLRERARTNGGGGEKDHVGEVPLSDPAWHNPCAVPGHIAEKRCPIFPCRHRGASWPGWMRQQWRRCARRL